MKMMYSIFLVAIATIVLSGQSSAQLPDFYSSAGYSTLINNLTNNYIWNSSMKAYTKSYRGNTSPSRSTSASTQSRPEVVPEYRRYPAVQFKPTGTRLTLQEYLDSVNIGAKDKADLKQLVLNIFKDYEAEAAAKGYPNDWALAFVSYVGLNSRIYNGKTDKPLLPFEQNIGVRDVVAEYATDHDTFRNVTDKQKQELYELLIIIGGLTYHYYEKAVRENNADDIKSCQLAAADNLKRVGVKP